MHFRWPYTLAFGRPHGALPHLEESAWRPLSAARHLAPFALTVLAGCGGGGDGGGGGKDLTIRPGDFYVGGELFSEIDQTLTIVGLEGNTPRCEVASGTLASGLSLQPGCRIVGSNTAIGSYSATVSITVSGYKGSVTTFAYSGGTPLMLEAMPRFTASQASAQPLAFAQPVSALQILQLSGVSLRSGVVVQYQLTPLLSG